MQPAIASLEQQGWAAFQLDRGRASVVNQSLSFARQVADHFSGIRYSSAECLKPTTGSEARPSTLSKTFGLSAFPPHVDGSHLTIPYRFIILACENPGLSHSPTCIFDLRDIHEHRVKDRLYTSLYFFRNGRNSFYSSIIMRDRPFIRFDRGCMQPVDRDSVETTRLFEATIAASKITTINWQSRTILIIDNWRMLHARGGDQPACPTRRLIRINMR